MLGRNYRFVAANNLGQTMDIASVVIKARRWKYNSTGVKTWEASEASIASNAGTIASNAYSAGAAVDNSSDAYAGGTFKLTVVAPASASGSVTIWLQNSTDGGTTWPDNGRGIKVATFGFAAAGTYVATIEL